MKRHYDNGILPTLGGLCTLATVMGIGRFAYTALLPGMMEDYALDEPTAGIMAAWNYAGYLLGVLAVRGATHGRRRYALFVSFLLLSLATTAAMAFSHSIPYWHGIRFLSGLASGCCFVLCSSIVFDTLAGAGRPVLTGFMYSGVGLGIALGGLSAGPLQALGGPDAGWLGMTALCLPLALAAALTLRPGVNQAPPAPAANAKANAAHNAGQARQYKILLLVYFLEGFGYIIGTTFIVALVKQTTNSPDFAQTVWVITGCAAAVSAPLWRLAAGANYQGMLLAAFLLQGAGVLLPALSASTAFALAGGLLLGGTFMGITVLSLQYGVSLSLKNSAHTIAIMTAVYGAGQIIGPFVAGFTARGQGFGPAFIISSIGLFAAAALLLALKTKK